MWRDLLTFTKSERRGLIVLCSILLFQFLFAFFRDTIFPPKVVQIRVEKLEVSADKRSKTYHKQLKLSAFNPNTVDCLQLIEMNIPTPIVNNLISFRKAGGKFRKPDDLQRLYAVDSAWMDSLRSAIDIPIVVVSTPKRSYSKSPKRWEQKSTKTQKLVHINPVVELNSADTSQLQKLRGIGNVFAQRIIKYRTLLGGFCTLDQLNEVYGLKPETIEQILPYITVDTSQISKIAINKLWFYSLKKHPYCTKNQANAIINYRKSKGVIADWRQLQTVKVDSCSWNKLQPYIDYRPNTE